MDKGMIILLVILGFFLVAALINIFSSWLARRSEERKLKLKAELAANWQGDQATLEKMLAEIDKRPAEDEDEDD